MPRLPKLKKDYATAARFYRICNICYENGELGYYNAEADKKGCEAYYKYWEDAQEAPKGSSDRDKT